MMVHMAFDWYMVLVVIAAGILCGFINTLAGSGSIISLPLLIFLGLPANVANGTNRIAILLQSAVGAASFHKKKKLDLKNGLYLSIAAIVGSLIGARIAIELDEILMRRVIGALMLVMLVFILFKPEKWLREHSEIKTHKPTWLQIIIFFFIGVYGGFIQIGVGIFLLTALVLNVGYDLVRANAIKLLITCVFTIFALAVFIMYDQVNYLWGFILAIGNVTGALIATRFAMHWGPKYIRYILIAVILVSAADLLGIINLF